MNTMSILSRLVFSVLLLVILGSTIAVVIWKSGANFNITPTLADQSLTAAVQQFTNQAASSTVSIQPFREMTIPYLRSRMYESQVGDLKKVSDNGNYTSYLTSYTSDGLKVNGLLTQPKGKAPEGGWPAIVFVHGYIPPTLYQTQQRYIAYVDNLARSGFVVFKIDLRGHGQSEGEPGGAYYSSDYVIDTLNAYSALQNLSFVNSQKIGLWGHSMAGNIVLRSMATKPEIPAAVIWAGAGYSYEDLQTYRLNDNSYRPPSTAAQSQQRRQRLFDTHGQFNVGSAFWREVAPTNYLQDLKGAIQVHHAVNDTVVSVNYTRDLMAKLDKTSVPHQAFEYATGGHDIESPSFSTAMKRTVDFFKARL